MDSVDVIIVGGGPAGLALANLLSQRRVSSIVLEQSAEIVKDPRAIALTGDALRISHLLGIGPEKQSQFAQRPDSVKFHFGSWASEPFLTIEQDDDALGHGTEAAMMILQPDFERSLREEIESSSYTSLLTECRVHSRVERENEVEVTYRIADGSDKRVTGQYLVGADGKRGVVRKHFLEPYGVKQEFGLHSYSRYWVAANMRVHMPTEATHPDFPLWKAGYHPEELWDLFWPPGFHFCNHPTMPVATGRFGPASERYWRFEYELPPEYVVDDPFEDLRRQMRSHLTLQPYQLKKGSPAIDGPVEFPWDCVEVIRCAPALFEHKVVQKWSHNRTMLLGDAAHVFPPFGGQGIVSGLRDALSLSWRLCEMCRANRYPFQGELKGALLEGWAKEQRARVDQASRDTMRHGDLLLNKSWLRAQIVSLTSTALNYLPSIERRMVSSTTVDAESQTQTKGAFVLPADGGGQRMPQKWLRSFDGSITLSDRVWWENDGVLSLVVLRSPQDESVLQDLLTTVGRDDRTKRLLSRQAVHMLRKPAQILHQTDVFTGTTTVYTTATPSQMAAASLFIPKGYDPDGLCCRLRATTNFALIRPDSVIFSQATTLSDVERQLEQATKLLYTARL